MSVLRVPERYSPEWWAWIASGAPIFGMLTFGALYYLDVFESLSALVFGVAIGSILGDIVLAFSFEAIAPTRIVMAPGERATLDHEISVVGVIESGFDASSIGRICVRGEIWAARHHEGRELHSAEGDEVQIIGRDGLTFLISEVT